MTNFEKFQKLLEELFQLDQADLDFGIYRIMNQKRDQVVRFLEKDLLPQVKEAFGHYQSADKVALQAELDKAISQAKGLGVDPETTAKVKALREQMADSSFDVTGLENDVFSHLFTFFRRYYHEGDFISQRRYKDGVYAIPYEGEEVKLYWANHDQYYVKSSEYFRDYTFTMPSGKRVQIHLVAASSEQDNKKEAPGKERRFIICEENPIYEENGELFIRFEYKPDDGKKKQEALNQEAIDVIHRELNAQIKALSWLAAWDEELRAKDASQEDAPALLEQKIRDLTIQELPTVLRLPSQREVVFDRTASAVADPVVAPNDLLLSYIPNSMAEVDGVLRLEFRQVSTDVDKGASTEVALNRITSELSRHARLQEWQRELWKLAPTKSNPNRTVIQKHLTQYTARNTFDYFIHKDLGGFLRRELDFYIKNEVMHLDDIEHDTVPRVEQYLSKIKVIRKIAHKVIQFLEQLENFQRKLWLKKKFVVETNYCITLNRVPEELYPEIAANDAQREEWVRLFAIDKIEKDLNGPGYSKPLKADFLRANSHLVLDTAFFSPVFTSRLLASLDRLDMALDGLLIHSENHQAMHLLQSRYRSQVGTVFADPPYNTGVDGFPYKDSYQHSSWLAMVENRLRPLRTLLSPTGTLFLTIDFIEVSKLRLLCDDIFGPDNFLADVAWEKRYTRSNNAKRFYSLKDTVLCYRASEAVDVLREARSEKSKSNYTNPDNDPRGPWISSSYVNPATKAQRLNLVYPIHNPITGKVIEHPTHAWKYDAGTHSQHVADNRLYWGQDGGYELPRLKSFLSEAQSGMVPIDVWHHKDTGTTDDGGKALKALFGEEVFDNPKPTSLVRRAIKLCPDDSDGMIVFDHFAGSGTTGQAVIEQNREDEGSRKYVLIEMGSHFNSVLRPRLTKVVYSQDWDSGVPTTRLGCSHAFKYIRLESYEDALNNLELKRTDQQASLLEQDENLREQYILSYMLDVESRGSQSLLNVESFRNPDQYKLRVERNGETQLVNVDLVETFNWLLGLTVKHIDVIRGLRVVEGTNPDGDRALVLWRNLDEMSNDALDEWFQKQDYNTKDQEYDLIYVNGDNNLENLRRGDQTWKVRLIEEEFGRLMFDVEDV